MASKTDRLTSTPPNFSASVTTPIGKDIHASILWLPPLTESHINSEDPPPMSKMMTVSQSGSMSAADPATANSASVCRLITSSLRPVSVRTRSMKSPPFKACRQASVAISLDRNTFRRIILSVQTFRASTARVIAGLLSEPVLWRPSPNRTIRENASTTLNPQGAGLATRSRQLLVPRSRAAYTGGMREGDRCPEPLPFAVVLVLSFLLPSFVRAELLVLSLDGSKSNPPDGARSAPR